MPNNTFIRTDLQEITIALSKKQSGSCTEASGFEKLTTHLDILLCLPNFRCSFFRRNMITTSQFFEHATCTMTEAEDDEPTFLTQTLEAALMPGAAAERHEDKPEGW